MNKDMGDKEDIQKQEDTFQDTAGEGDNSSQYEDVDNDGQPFDDEDKKDHNETNSSNI